VGTLRPVQRVASMSGKATNVSNSLLAVGAGSGAAGGFNYADQQRLEAKQFKKNLGDGIVRGIGRVRVLNGEGKDAFRVLDNRDQYRIVPRHRLTWVPQKKAKGRLVSVDKPSPVQEPGQMELPFGKADDRFLRRYKSRISPNAEQGYKYLKRGRNRRVADAGVSTGLAGLATGLGVHSLRRGSKGWAAVNGAAAVLSGVSAAGSANDAARWNVKLGKIKAKAKEREAAGQYGRPVEKAEFSQNEKKGAAEIAAGGAALATGLSSGRAVTAYEQARVKRIDSKIARAPKAERNRVASQLGAKRKKILKPKKMKFFSL
jgi:hypothetical protein